MARGRPKARKGPGEGFHTCIVSFFCIDVLPRPSAGADGAEEGCGGEGECLVPHRSNYIHLSNYLSIHLSSPLSTGGAAGTEEGRGEVRELSLRCTDEISSESFKCKGEPFKPSGV